MNIILTAGIALITAVASIFGVINYMPISVLENAPEARFGSSITTINGSDTLSSSRTVINDNFTALNSTKIENSTTSVASITTLASLSTVGTIGSGIWNGTAIGVGYGGTGSTTLSSNQVMLGNGSSGLKVVNGWGTSNQVLTSGTGTSAPTWETFSVDQTASYNFTSSAFRVKNLHASSTAANPITLNGLSYSTPSIRAASSTVLMEDGSGSLSWNDTYSRRLYTTTTAPGTTQSASTTILRVTIPANTLGTSNSIRCQMGRNIENFLLTTTGILWTEIAFGNSTTTIVHSPGSTQNSDNVDFNLIAAGATNSQKFFLTGYGGGAGGTYRLSSTGTFSVDSTADNVLQIVAKDNDANASYFNPSFIMCTTIK